MAIQMRRGLLANYDESKMLAGEWGIAIDNDSDNQKAFIAFAPGVSKEVMLVEDAETQIQTATQQAIAEATQEAEAWAHGNSFDVNDYASGDGATTAFTLAETPTTIIAVYVDGETTTAYTLSDNTITFTTAPASGTNNIRVNYTVNNSTDNAKYYKEQAAQSASNASTSETNAGTSATNAHTSELNAAASATAAADSEAWAVGQKNGVDVPSSATQYHNNSKYYSEQAAASAASLTVDSAMSSSSTNPVQNKVINTAISTVLGDMATVETEYASRNFSEGEYIVLNNLLYKVTTDTSAAEEWEVGTNITATTAGAEITALNNNLTWKLAGEVTGKTSLQLPSHFNELQVNVTLEDNYQVTQYFTAEELNGGWYLWGCPYYSTISANITPAFATAYISKNQYGLYNARYGANDRSTTAVSRVYYR